MFLGPDGSGKTLLANRVAERCHRMFSSVKRIHLGNRPILLPSLRGGKNKLGPTNQVEGVQPLEYHSGKTPKKYNKVYNSIRYLYHISDFILHYCFFLRPSLANNSLILSERYIYDYLAVPQRFIYGVPMKIRRIGALFVPKPDYVFYIEVSPNTILERKCELPLNILIKEQENYKKLLKQIEFAYSIDNNRSFEDAEEQITRIILCGLHG